MKKQIIVGVGILLVLCFAWATLAQPQGGGPGGGRGGFGRMREARTQALAALQEQIGKLKALMEAPAGMRGGADFQDMSDEERTKMREDMMQRREEQQKIMASMQQQVDTLRGGRELVLEHDESMAPLKDLLASAEKEKATETAAKVKDLIAQRDKQFEAKMAAMDIAPEQIDRYRQMGQRGMGGMRGPRGQQ